MSNFGVPSNYADLQQRSQVQAQSSPTFQSAYQLAQMGAGLQQQQYNNQYNSLINQYQNSNAGYGLNYGSQMLNYQGNLGDLNTQIGSNQIDLAAALRQDPYIAKLQDLSAQGYQNQLGALGLTRDTNLADLLSQQTTQGSTQTRGNRQQKGFINQDYALGAQSAGINQQKDQLGLSEQRAQAKDRVAQLQLEASNLGTKPALLKSQLDNALAQLGLSNKVTTDQIMDGLASNDLNMKMLYLQLIQQFALPATNAAG